MEESKGGREEYSLSILAALNPGASAQSYKITLQTPQGLRITILVILLFLLWWFIRSCRGKT